MSSAPATPERVGAVQAPQPIAPVGGMPVDGSAVTFSWTEAPGALTYRLQVAADTGFEQVVCTLEAGSTTLFTLLEMLPQDGSVFHWRVQAQTALGWQPWSSPETFKARTDQHEIAFRAKQETAVRQGAPPSAVAQTGAPVEAAAEPELYQVGHTSKGTMALVLTVMLIAFAAIFTYMVYVVTSAQ